MRFFQWNCYPDPPDNSVDRHELAHMRACRGERTPYSWVTRPGTGWVIEGTIGYSREGQFKAAVTLMAGALAGGGDDAGDRDAVEQLIRENGGAFTVAEVEKSARRYVR